MQEENEMMNVSPASFLNGMIEMDRLGRKSEALKLIKLKLDEISKVEFITKSSRRNYRKKLNSLLLDIGADKISGQLVKRRTLQEEVLEMYQLGKKAEAINLIQSRIDEISQNVETKSSIRKRKSLNRMLLEVQADQISKNDGGNSSDILLDQQFQVDNADNSEMNPTIAETVEPIVLPGVSPPPMSNFLVWLKEAIELVEAIGKIEAVKLIEQKIQQLKRVEENWSEREIKSHRKIINILTREDFEHPPFRRKKTNRKHNTLPNVPLISKNITLKKKKKKKTQDTNFHANASCSSKPKIKTEPTAGIQQFERNEIETNRKHKSLPPTVPLIGKNISLKKKKKTQDTNCHANESCSNKPKIKTEPTAGIEQFKRNQIKIENTKDWPTKVIQID